MLRRDSGPSGWIDFPASRFELDGWELFEGDPANPHMCRGWFRCTAAGFRAPRGTALTMELARRDGTTRRLDVQVTHAKRTEPEWEFMARR